MAAPLPELPRLTAAELRARLVRPEGPPSPRFSDTLRALHQRMRQQIEIASLTKTRTVMFVREDELKPLKGSGCLDIYGLRAASDHEPLYYTATRYQRALQRAFPRVHLRFTNSHAPIEVVEAKLRDGQAPTDVHAQCIEAYRRDIMAEQKLQFTALPPERTAWCLTADWSEYGSAELARAETGIQSREDDGWDGVDY